MKYPQLDIVIITLGKEGAFAYDAVAKKFANEPCFEGKVVSTVGAGDGFSAAFLTEYTYSRDVVNSVRFANRFATYVVAHVEAIPDHSGFCR